MWTMIIVDESHPQWKGYDGFIEVNRNWSHDQGMSVVNMNGTPVAVSVAITGLAVQRSDGISYTVAEVLWF